MKQTPYFSRHFKNVLLRLTKKIVKTSKRKAQSKSNSDAVADILDWAENLESFESSNLPIGNKQNSL